MAKRPHDESSASSRDAANDQQDQADPTEVTSDATIDVTPASAGQTLGDASADRAESSASQDPAVAKKTDSEANLPSRETAADLGATIDSPSALPDHTASEAAEEPLDQTVDVPATPSGQSQASETDAETGQAPTPIREMASDPATRHTVTRFLAEGGLGKVYVAQDDKLQREVVMKTLKDAGGEDSEARYRFVQEAQVNSQLEHPNIIPIYQAGDGADGQPYYTMKYVRGQQYRDLIQGYHQNRREGNVDALELRRLLTLFISTCQAVSYAHNRGVVHRDLKPENIAVGEFGELMVLDWGLAKVLGEPDAETSRAAVTIADGIDLGQTMQGRIMGTPGYMAPEQASGETDAIEPRTDVYSLGAMLFEILTGEAPHALLHNYDPNQIQRWNRRESHSGTAAGQESVSSLASQHPSGQHENTMTLLARVIAGTVPAPSDLEPTVPRALEAICQRAMRLKIEDRYTTASDLAHDVERWLADEPVTVYAGSWNERLGRWMRKHRTKVQTIGASFALIALVAVVSSILINNQRSIAVTALAKQQAAERDRLVAQVDRFRQAAATAAPVILSELDVTSTDIETVLRDRLKDSSQTDLEENRIRLALLKVDPDQLDPIVEYLQSESGAQMSPAELLLIRGVLEIHGSKLTSRFEPLLSDPSQRLRAACMLAGFAPQADWWRSHVENIASDLVRVLPSQLAPYRDALRPVKEHLIVPLSAIYRDDSSGEQVRSFATDALADYLSEDAGRLFDLLADSSEQQFGTIFDKLAAHQQRAIALGNAEITRSVTEDAAEVDRAALAVRQANAALLLLRMNAADQVWPLLQHSSDPRVRSYLIHWLNPRGGNAQPILARYEQETDLTIQRALLLCLGEFELADSEQQPLIETLLDVYRNAPDAGLHAAAEWLLRQWRQGQTLAGIDLELQQKEAELVAARDDQRQWYINSQGQTFVILDAGEFLMGSPEGEVDRRPDEKLHRRKIGRRIAIATTEVTKEQWRVFSSATKVFSVDQDEFKKWGLPYTRTDDSPMIGIKWYEAAHYCNWLSEQEGIPEEQWCYEQNEDGEYGPGMKARENFLALTGYRLPTESEWEYACRAGARSSRYYGVTETLLPRYAWYKVNGEGHTHPVASLKPNDYGLFDMQGNVNEWCYEPYIDYPPPGKVEFRTDAGGKIRAVSRAVKDAPPTASVEETGERALRGSSFGMRPHHVRSAVRNHLPPPARASSTGFRPARTYHLFP